MTVVFRSIKILFLSIVLIYGNDGIYGQSGNSLKLEEILDHYYLGSDEAKKIDYQNQQEKLLIDNFQLYKLPSISFNVNPLNFSQSIVSLQDPSTGNFNYTNSYVNNSSVGLSLNQPINITGGNIQLNSSINMMNELSLKRNTFSSIPLHISYYQPLFSGRKSFKFNEKLNELKKKICQKQLKMIYTPFKNDA